MYFLMMIFLTFNNNNKKIDNISWQNWLILAKLKLFLSFIHIIYNNIDGVLLGWKSSIQNIMWLNGKDLIVF